MRFLATFLIGALCMAKAATAQTVDLTSPENTLLLELKDGVVEIQLRPDLAPKHVARVKELVRQGFYDGLTFHRVIEGFMAQTGDPKGDGTGGSGKNIKAEFTSKAEFVRGTVGAARAMNPNSADSQFFICFKPAPFLNGQYTIWGQVIKGMEHVDKITRGEPPSTPDKIISMKIAADVKNAAPAAAAQ